VAVTYAVFGVFMWDWAQTFWKFELPMYMGKRTWRWPLVLYYLNRIVAFLFLVFTMLANAAYMVQTDSMMGVSCDRMVQAILAFAVIQATLSSLVLALRAMALYEFRYDVVVFLGFLMLAQFSLAIPVITTIPWTKGFPDGAIYCGNALTISDMSHLYCAINYLLTAVVDISVYIITVRRLLSGNSLNPSSDGGLRAQASAFWVMLTDRKGNLGQRPIAQVLTEQGAVSVLLTLAFNLPVMILEFIHLNGQAVYIPYNIGVPMNAIISCYIITSLYKHSNRTQQSALSSGRTDVSNQRYVFSPKKQTHDDVVEMDIVSGGTGTQDTKIDMERGGW